MSISTENTPHCKTLRQGPFRFQDLVLDIQIYTISSFLPPRDLKSLSLVSRDLRTLAIPAIYADARLVFGVQPTSRKKSNGFRDFTSALIAAQQDFTFQFLTHLERANHVRSLAWQFLSNAEVTLAGLFPLLSNLRSVHLINPHPTHIKDLTLTIPPLFPRIGAVKITGTTALFFVTPMLHSPHNLTSISFDIIQPHIAALDLLRWVKSTPLPRVRSLSLRALTQTRNAQHWDTIRENELFSAWADALSSVRSSVENVTLGFRARRRTVPGEYTAAPTRSSATFERVVMPIFGQEESWPRLQVLRLEGIDIDGVVAVGCALRLRVTVTVNRKICGVPTFWNSDPTDDI